MSAALTRRRALAGAAAGAALPVVARARAVAQTPPGSQGVVPMAEPELVLRGRDIAVDPRGRRLVVTHDRGHTISILGRGGARAPAGVDVGGQPLECALSPSGRTAAVTTAFWDEPGLAIVDVAGATLRERLDVGAAPGSVAFTPDGRRIVVVGGEQDGVLRVIDARGGKQLAEVALGRVPRSVAIDREGRRAWVALNGADRVLRVDLHDNRVTLSLPTPWLPDRVAVSPDGLRLLVSHGGPDAEHLSEISVRGGRLRRLRAGRQPSAVAWTERGRRLAALGGSGEIVVFGERGAPRRHRVGGSPRGLAVAGRRAWTVDALGGTVRGVRT